MAFIHNNIGSTKRGLGLLFYQNQAYLYFQKNHRDVVFGSLLCLDLHGYTTGFLEQWIGLIFGHLTLMENLSLIGGLEI